MDDVKLCKDCRHYLSAHRLSAKVCQHQRNLRTDYVNGGRTSKNSADFLRADVERCGPKGAWWEPA